MEHNENIAKFVKYFSDLIDSNFCKIELDVKTGNTVKSAIILKCEAELYNVPSSFAGGRFVEVFNVHHSPLHFLIVGKDETVILQGELNNV